MKTLDIRWLPRLFAAIYLCDTQGGNSLIGKPLDRSGIYGVGQVYPTMGSIQSILKAGMMSYHEDGMWGPKLVVEEYLDENLNSRWTVRMITSEFDSAYNQVDRILFEGVIKQGSDKVEVRYLHPLRW